MFIGTVCGTVANMDPHGALFKQRMDELNFFLREERVPQPLCVRARDHLRATRQMAKRSSYAALLDLMSPGLTGEVVLQLSKRLLLVACNAF